MALEAGSCMHEVFAAVRIWQLDHIQKLPKHAEAVASRIFSLGRWKAAVRAATARNTREQLMELSFEILHSSGFFDDERDKIRTMSNMEICSICYIDESLSKMENWPIYVEDKKNPKSVVGIEQTFDVVLEFVDGKKLRYVGTIDGLVENRTKGILVLDENKTASRLDQAWRDSFLMANQVSGYCAASTSVFGFPVMEARVTGLRIKSGAGEDVIPLDVRRDINFVFSWAHWLRHTIELYEKYEKDYENAPRYTHSCNRYYRPCSLIPFCADTPSGRAEQWEQMVPADPSPSERAVESL